MVTQEIINEILNKDVVKKDDLKNLCSFCGAIMGKLGVIEIPIEFLLKGLFPLGEMIEWNGRIHRIAELDIQNKKLKLEDVWEKKLMDITMADVIFRAIKHP